MFPWWKETLITYKIQTLDQNSQKLTLWCIFAVMDNSLKYIRPAKARTSMHIGSLIKVFDVCLPTRCIPGCVLGFRETLILTMCSQIVLVLSVGPGNNSSRKYTPSHNPEIPLQVSGSFGWRDPVDGNVRHFYRFFFLFCILFISFYIRERNQTFPQVISHICFL